MGFATRTDAKKKSKMNKGKKVGIAVLIVVLLCALSQCSSNNQSPSSTAPSGDKQVEQKADHGKLVSIEATYNGSTEEGTEISRKSDITVTGTYEDGTIEDVDNWGIDEVVTLKAGKTSKVRIFSEGNVHTVIKVKCITPMGEKLGDIKFNVDDVRNDVTGNWRICTTSERIQMQDYALDYYKTYFKSDDEVHAIVNFTYNTTTKISVIGGKLDVVSYEYVKGEEHDAKLLFSGMKLAAYTVDIETGKIKKQS